jgi:hypothetical protein
MPPLLRRSLIAREFPSFHRSFVASGGSNISTVICPIIAPNPAKSKRMQEISFCGSMGESIRLVNETPALMRKAPEIYSPAYILS